MKLLQFYSEWLEHDGKTVYVDGRKSIIRVSTVGDKISVMADPVNKRSKEYLQTKRELGDDWSTDVLDSSLEIECEVLEQCRNLSSL